MISSVTIYFDNPLKRVIFDALEEHGRNVSISGRNVTNDDNIDALAVEEDELETLVERFDKTCEWYKMEISAEKTTLLINSANGIQSD